MESILNRTSEMTFIMVAFDILAVLKKKKKKKKKPQAFIQN